MPDPQNGQTIPEVRRRELFAALIEAQDREMSVAESRADVARRFGVSEAQVRGVEREGLDNAWPPL
jgi:hypothetical protein